MQLISVDAKSHTEFITHVAEVTIEDAIQVFICNQSFIEINGHTCIITKYCPSTELHEAFCKITPPILNPKALQVRYNFSLYLKRIRKISFQAEDLVANKIKSLLVVCAEQINRRGIDYGSVSRDLKKIIEDTNRKALLLELASLEFESKSYEKLAELLIKGLLIEDFPHEFRINTLLKATEKMLVVNGEKALEYYNQAKDLCAETKIHRHLFQYAKVSLKLHVIPKGEMEQFLREYADIAIVQPLINGHHFSHEDFNEFKILFEKLNS